MKTYKATYWRGNPQLKSGGYETTRMIEAKTLAAARKRADKVSCVYGSMELRKVEEVKK